MINITNEEGKRRVVKRLTILQNNIERAFEKELKRLINSQFRIAAKLIASDREEDLERVINVTRKKLEQIISKRYRITATISNNEMQKDLKKSALAYSVKGQEEDFWRVLNSYIAKFSLIKAKGINDTTKKALRLIIQKGINAGDSSKVIAQKLRATGKVNSAFRAIRIARTEVHSAMTFSMQQSAKATKILNEKEWVSAKDDRTRTTPFDHLGANGERVSMEESYIMTGEALKTPGDESGSKGNIIHCRCVEIFHTGV